jgi:hypothetical protein
MEGLTGDPSGISGCKEGRHGGDVLRLADAAQRRLRLDVFAKLALRKAGGMDAFGLNHARADRIDADFARPELLGERLVTAFTAALVAL